MSWGGLGGLPHLGREEARRVVWLSWVLLFAGSEGKPLNRDSGVRPHLSARGSEGAVQGAPPEGQSWRGPLLPLGIPFLKRLRAAGRRGAVRVGEAVRGAFWDLGRGGVGGAAREDSAEVAAGQSRARPLPP